MSDRFGLALEKLDRVWIEGKPGGQDKGREVRPGWGMVFLKPFNTCPRGVRLEDRLRASQKDRNVGLSRTSRRPK